MRNFHFPLFPALVLAALLGSPLAQAQKTRPAKAVARPATSTGYHYARQGLSVEMLPPPSVPAAKVAASKVPQSSTTGEGTRKSCCCRCRGQAILFHPNCPKK